MQTHACKRKQGERFTHEKSELLEECGGMITGISTMKCKKSMGGDSERGEFESESE